MLQNPLFRFGEYLYRKLKEHEITALGAQMTFYLILSFFPFLIFLITVLNYTPLTDEEVVSSLISVLPQESALLVNQVLSDALKATNQTLLSIGMIATVWTASRGVMAILRGINKAYGIEEERPFWKIRGIAILYTFVFVFIILLSFALLVFGNQIGTFLFEYLLIPLQFEKLWQLLKYAVPLTILIFVFIFLYMMAPSQKIKWTEVIPGALFTTFGWITISFLFSVYVAYFGNYSKTYGSLGGIIILLLWLYISSITVLLGGEINAAWKHWKENRIVTVSKYKEE